MGWTQCSKRSATTKKISESWAAKDIRVCSTSKFSKLLRALRLFAAGCLCLDVENLKLVSPFPDPLLWTLLSMEQAFSRHQPRNLALALFTPFSPSVPRCSVTSCTHRMSEHFPLHFHGSYSFPLLSPGPLSLLICVLRTDVPSFILCTSVTLKHFSVHVNTTRS